MGLLPVLILFVLALWQLGLVGYTYVLAGHAAREGARMMAVNPTDGEPDDEAYKKIRTRAMEEVPQAVAQAAPRSKCPKRRVARSPSGSTVPIVLPGLKLAVRDRLALPPRRSRTRSCRRSRRSRRSRREAAPRCATQRGQASAEFLGMVFWLLLAAVCVWQLMLAAWTVNQATNAARTASRVAAARRRPREGGAQRASRARCAAASTTSAGRARRPPCTCTIPIILPGPTADGLSVTRSATLPG